MTVQELEKKACRIDEVTLAFDQWFAKYLKQDPVEVKRLLNDKTATRFLIAWSLFESRCFEGFVKVDKFSEFANRVKDNDAFQKEDLLESGRHFHRRYQDKDRYNNLMHKQKNAKLESILSKQFDALSYYELVFMLLFVVYRYRNNIFHGNKGVESWLKYKEQINFCLRVMQSLISLTTCTDNDDIIL
ncbi:MAG: hypothetical protein JSW47_22595 [Phycisphaerales bacterium]|nr:MAG: hypothetical protein JSW47_22595 [Phycisphaerales bacterium]